MKKPQMAINVPRPRNDSRISLNCISMPASMTRRNTPRSERIFNSGLGLMMPSTDGPQYDPGRNFANHGELAQPLHDLAAHPRGEQQQQEHEDQRHLMFHVVPPRCGYWFETRMTRNRWQLGCQGYLMPLFEPTTSAANQRHSAPGS